MKKILIVMNIIAFAILSVICLTACNSQTNPVPSEYRGTYSDWLLGYVTVDSSSISSSGIALTKCIINGQVIEGDAVSWPSTNFDYNKNKTFSFTTNAASATIANVEGQASFSGSLADRVAYYEMQIGCTGCNAEISLIKTK